MKGHFVRSSFSAVLWCTILHGLISRRATSRITMAFAGLSTKRLHLLVFALLCCLGAAPGQNPASASAKSVPGELLVKFRPTTARSSQAVVHIDAGATVLKRFTSVPGLQLVKVNSGNS